MKKTAGDYQIGDWDEAEAALGRLARIDADERELKARADEEINQVRGRLKTKLDSLAEQRDIIEENLRGFAEERRAEFEPQKSRSLRFGVIGFRSIPRFIWPRKNETLIQRLRELGLKSYIRIKEEPDKQGIMAHAGMMNLKALGVRRETTEEFYIEINNEI